MEIINRIFFIIFLIICSSGFAAEKSIIEKREIKTITIDTTKVEGKLKAGVVLGYPLGVTAGYRFSNVFELNGIIGSNYDDLSLGVNGLFTLINLEISREIFPLSIGPALYTHFDHHDGSSNNGNDDEYTKIDLLGIARLEYSFKEIPLNLFVEAGIGLELVKFTDTAGSFAIGVRYIF